VTIPKTWITVGLLLACAAVPYGIPELSAWRALDLSRLPETLAAPWRGAPLGKVFRAKGEARQAGAAPGPADNAASAAPAPPLPPANDGFGDDWPPGAAEDAYAAGAHGAVGIEDYGEALPRFFEALARTARKTPRAVTRISHFGDSPVTGDLIAGDARARLQSRFGDAGHGWIFVDRPWEWYSHRGVRLSGRGWSIQPPGASSGPCGLGGAAFTASGSQARSRIATGKSGAGSAVGRFDIHFQSKPKGGTLLASIDGLPPVEIATASEEGGGLVVHSIPVADGGHELVLRPKGDGPVRVFGVALERELPGVVYDTLGANGATIRHLARFDRESWIDSLRMRRPDLVILNYGTNESQYAGLSFGAYARDYREVIRRVREALPGGAILVMAPMDRGVRVAGGGIGTDESIPRLVAAQRFIARSERVAFFDTYAAMGGAGTMAGWYARSPRLVAGDFTHPTHQGAAVVGDLLVDALMKRYASPRSPEISTPEGVTR
jgi:lysophospholipase L1-like esterase